MALILAAGFSSRMRGFKPLLPLPYGDSQDVCFALECLARTYRAAGVEHLCVVSGHRAEDVEAEARRLGLHSVRNTAPEQGMFSSVCTGLRALHGHHAFCFVHPVDIPLVRPLTVQRLWQARHAQRPCLPVFRGEEGHPLLLPAPLWDAALRWQGACGLHGWLHALPAAQGLVRVTVPDRLTLCDMDTDAAYARLRRRAARQHILEPAECRELLHLEGVHQKGLAHGRCVGRVAAALAVALREGKAQGCASLLGTAWPDPALACGGGLLHDICKGQPHHEAAAGEKLRAAHLPLMAALVEGHKDMTLTAVEPVTERELVYLADKYVLCHGPATLEQRFGAKLRLFIHDDEARRAVEERWRNAQALEVRLAHMLGASPAQPFLTAQQALHPTGRA